MRTEQIGNATQKVTAIYALCEWPSQAPRYVGKTTQYLVDRHKAHFNAAHRGGKLPVHYWLRKRLAAGGSSAIKLIEWVLPGEDWAARERHWIAEYRRLGHSLLNLTAGGEGLTGHQFSDDHRQKIASALRSGAHIACLQCGATAWRKKNEIAKGDAKFCSRACYAASLKGVPRPVAAGVQELGREAAALKRKAQTHCKRGHSLSGENAFLTSSGGRGCRACRRIHKANYLERKHG